MYTDAYNNGNYFNGGSISCKTVAVATAVVLLRLIRTAFIMEISMTIILQIYRSFYVYNVS